MFVIRILKSDYGSDNCTVVLLRTMYCMAIWASLFYKCTIDLLTKYLAIQIYVAIVMQETIVLLKTYVRFIKYA